MSYIEYRSGKPPKIVWDDTNYIGLTEAWIAELVAKGYEFEDRRSPPSAERSKGT